MAKKFFSNIRKNPETGELEYFFPQQIVEDGCDDPVRTKKAAVEYAKLHGLEIGWSRLGFRVFEAMMIPCKKRKKNPDGTLSDEFLPTSSEEQHRIYLELIKDEMNSQEDIKQDGRCQIPDGHGGVKRCPRRIPNPDYKPDGNMPKTLAVKCEGCKYEPYKNEKSTVNFSTLSGGEDEDEEKVPYEPESPRAYNSGSQFEKLREEYLAFVMERDPKLYELADLLTLEYSKSEAGRELDTASSTVTSRMKKLKKLTEEFLDTVIPIC